MGLPKLEDYGLVYGGPTPFLLAVTGFGGPEGLTPVQQAARRASEYVVEGFTKGNPRAKIHPLETVGMVRALGAAWNKPVTVSRPKERMSVTHDDLKRIDWWPGGEGHADTAQAIRHVLAMLLREGHRELAMLISPPDPETLADMLDQRFKSAKPKLFKPAPPETSQHDLW